MNPCFGLISGLNFLSRLGLDSSSDMGSIPIRRFINLVDSVAFTPGTH